MSIDEIIDEKLSAKLAEFGFKPEPEPKLISTAKAAEIMDISQDAVVALAHQSKANGFPCIWLSSKTLRIDQNRLNQWFAARQGVSV